MKSFERWPSDAGVDPFRAKVGLLVGSTSARSGGVGEAVCALAQALVRTGKVQVEVFTLRHRDEIAPDLGSIPVCAVPQVGPASFGYSAGLAAQLRRRRIDVLHVHGLWMYQSIAASRWARSTGLPYIVSPHGMLDPWALKNSRIRKSLARRLYEDRHLGKAGFIHALCQGEAESIRLARVETPIVIIPNGVTPVGGSSPMAPWREALGHDARVLLYLGRITAKKQVLELVEAWAKVGQPHWHLAIVGPAEPAYSEKLEYLVAANGLGGHVQVLPPAYGEARATAYASADAFVLPSLSEGLPMAVLEAFAAGLPALLTPQCNLPDAIAHGCALPIEASVEGIETGLRQLFAMPEEAMRQMGQKARDLVRREFDWDIVARRFAIAYSELAVRG
jgi:poly(glycerol-phosphate) alpha-glucosyltransferase